MGEKQRIVIAEDHTILREGLRALLASDPDLEIVGEAEDGLKLLLLLEQRDPDLVILDISMPNMSGLEAAWRVKQNYPDIKVLIVTIHNIKEYADHAMSAGAEGYLLKEEVSDELLPAITSLRQGGTYFSSRLAV